MRIRIIGTLAMAGLIACNSTTESGGNGPRLELLIDAIAFGSGVVRTEPDNIRYEYGTGGGGGGGGNSQFAEGDIVRLVAEPTAGSRFIGFMGEGCTDGALTCTPTFDRVTFVKGYLVGPTLFEGPPPETVDVSVSLTTYIDTTDDPRLEGAGSVRLDGVPGGPVTCVLARTEFAQCSAPGGPVTLPITVAEGSTVTLTAMPDPDSRFRRWLVPGCAANPTCVITVRYQEFNWLVDAWFEGQPVE